MKREIKFKIWNKKKNQWHHEKPISLFGEVIIMGEILNANLEDEPMLISELEDLVPLQYTGLKDRNGIEIYEGDIVAVRGFSSGLEKEINEIETIKDIREVFLDYNIANAQDAGMSIEVIGNIYEDSELLEKEGKE